ncbi:MAG: hypothetical protein ACPLXO_02970 [Desulfurella sp.]
MKGVLKQISETGLFGGFSFQEIRKENEIIGVVVTLVRKDWDIPFQMSVYCDDLPSLPEVPNKSYVLRKIALMQAVSLVFWDAVDLEQKIKQEKKVAFYEAAV